SQAVVEAAVDQEPATQHLVLRRMADAIATTDHARASAVAIGCGAIVENGGDPDIAIGPLPAHPPATPAPAAPLLGAGEQLAGQAHAEGEGESEAEGEAESEEEEEGDVVDRFGYQVAQELPDEGQAWLSLRPMALGAIALLGRSSRARQQARGTEHLL